MRMALISFFEGRKCSGRGWWTLYVSFHVPMTLPSLVLLLPLAGCTGAQSYDPPFNPNEKAEKQIPPFYGMGMPGYLSRQEVIHANQECEDAGMKSRIVYMSMTVLEKKIPVPVDVHCEPKRLMVTSPYYRPGKE